MNENLVVVEPTEVHDVEPWPGGGLTEYRVKEATIPVLKEKPIDFGDGPKPGDVLVMRTALYRVGRRGENLKITEADLDPREAALVEQQRAKIKAHDEKRAR